MLDDRDCVALRRIQTEQSCPAFQDFHHERSGCRFPIFDRLALERHFELIQPHQLEGQRALQIGITVQLDRMSIERCMHGVDRAIVCPGNGVDALVSQLIVVHGATSEISPWPQQSTTSALRAKSSRPGIFKPPAGRGGLVRLAGQESAQAYPALPRINFFDSRRKGSISYVLAGRLAPVPPGV
jgi:hypothetical protein